MTESWTSKGFDLLQEEIISEFCWDRMREICGKETTGQHKYKLMFKEDITSDTQPLCVGSAKTKAELHSRRVLAQEFVQGEYDIVLIQKNEREIFSF